MTQTADQDETRLHLARTATQRSGLYRLLAAIFRQEPGSELIEWLRSERFENLLSQAGFELGDEFSAKATEIVKEELAVEFTRLFLGPGKHISPHESVQLPDGSGTLWGKESVLVKRFIEAAGFDYERDFNGIPDHISVELDFLALLTEAEAGNWKAGDTGSGVNVLDWQGDFVARHAGKWMPGFCAKVEKAARLPFYRVFSELLKTFLAGEKEEISAGLQTAFPQGRDLSAP
ncbi:MAG: molecular chaperone TorD family protein [Alphaproteobacteria bacterium]|nr:molecular chaperone TorD family protein [Alphaproteobacteria bacterium]